MDYSQLDDAATNLKALLQAQNAAGETSALESGWEPDIVLAAKTIFNASNAAGSGTIGGVLPPDEGGSGVNNGTTNLNFGPGGTLTSGAFNTRVVYASTTAALDSNVLTGGGTDDTAAIQAILDLASDGVTNVELVMDGAALVHGLHIYSNTTIRCLNRTCGFYLKDQSNVSIVRNAHPSQTVVTDKHIAFIGGTYNGNPTNQTAFLSPDAAGDTILHGIALYGVDDAKLSGVLTLYSNFMATMFSFVSNLIIENCENQNYNMLANDGYHFVGGCSYVTIKDVKGTCGADFIALNATDYEDRAPGTELWVLRSAPIRHVTIDNVFLQDSRNGIGLVNGSSICDDISINGVHGRAQAYAVSLWNPWSTSFDTGYIGTVSINDIDATQTIANSCVITIFSETNGSGPVPGRNLIKNLQISNVQWDPTGNERGWLLIDSKAQIESLQIDGVLINEETENTIDIAFIQTVAAIGRLSIANFNWVRPPAATINKGVVANGTGGTITTLNLLGISTNRMGSTYGGGGTFTTVNDWIINGAIKGSTIQSTVATGTAPLTVASTTNVANLNASSLNGATFAAPGTIGGTTPGAAGFTSIAVTGAATLSTASGTTRVGNSVALSSPITGAFTVSDGSTLATAVGIGSGNIQTGGATSVIGAATQSGVTLSLGLAGSASGDSKALVCVPGGYSGIGTFGTQATGTKFVLYNNATDTDAEIGVGGTAGVWIKSQGNGLTNAFELYGNSSNSGTADLLLRTTKTGVTTVAAATATPAGGSTAASLLMGTTAGFGIYFGSGAPTVSAGKGSLYLRSDGSGIADRMYVNTNGSTTWTSVATSA